MLAPLERLSELVERVVVLLDEAPDALAPEAGVGAAGHVLFVPDAAGYRLVARSGAPPARGERLELGGARLRVVRVGPSPLPGDGRRCAFLEQEPLAVERSETSAGGEPDRGDEGGASG